MSKILVTGGDGRFATELKKFNKKNKFIFLNKKELNILNYKSIVNSIKKYRPKIILHLASLSRPMILHERNISKSIDLNIVGTCNVVKACETKNIKIIYFSTSYVYPGTKGNYKENDSVLPWNNYGWSKLGGECAVQMYHNSLIIRACMTEKPFIHKKAFEDFITNFTFHEEVAKNLYKLINKKGIINVGGEIQSVYDFAKKYNKKIEKISAKKHLGTNLPLNLSMNISKYKKIIK